MTYLCTIKWHACVAEKMSDKKREGGGAEDERILTRKNVIVEPPSSVPYEMSCWSARSAAFSIGVIILSTVRKAARFAV